MRTWLFTDQTAHFTLLSLSAAAAALVLVTQRQKTEKLPDDTDYACMHVMFACKTKDSIEKY